MTRPLTESESFRLYQYHARHYSLWGEHPIWSRLVADGCGGVGRLEQGPKIVLDARGQTLLHPM